MLLTPKRSISPYWPRYAAWLCAAGYLCSVVQDIRTAVFFIWKYYG